MKYPYLSTMQDSSGSTALHVSIQTKQPHCSHLLLAHPSLDLTVSNKAHCTVFAAALEMRDNEVGRAILQRDPSVAEQVRTLMICMQCTII